MTEAPRQGEADHNTQRAGRLPYGVAAVKLVFILAVLRLFAGPMTKDLLDEELLPMPTWEWALCALTPPILIYVARRPEDWGRLSGERTFLRISLVFYALYALAFAVFQGVWILWIAVAAGFGSLAWIRHLDSREHTRAQ
ncbi:hypothetical protein [Streptomyces sp. NPDC058694]|uniref:hypothetical protein n=1 Tax=Streptomyces sp. NPDC058694 TaxID=3346603 RepID=UPI00365FF67A